MIYKTASIRVESRKVVNNTAYIKIWSKFAGRVIAINVLILPSRFKAKPNGTTWCSSWRDKTEHFFIQRIFIIVPTLDTLDNSIRTQLLFGPFLNSLLLTWSWQLGNKFHYTMHSLNLVKTCKFVLLFNFFSIPRNISRTQHLAKPILFSFSARNTQVIGRRRYRQLVVAVSKKLAQRRPPPPPPPPGSIAAVKLLCVAYEYVVRVRVLARLELRARVAGKLAGWLAGWMDRWVTASLERECFSSSSPPASKSIHTRLK